MPLNAAEIEGVRKEAVKAAEVQTEEKKRGKIQNVIDADEEVKAFFRTAYQALDRYLQVAQDPQLREKRDELEAAYKKSQETLKDYYIEEEKAAHEYWEELLLVLEKEEREGLQHGPDFLKKLGVPPVIKLIKFDKNNEGHPYYHVEKDHFKYMITFKPNGEIELKTWAGNNRWLQFYQTNKAAHYDSLDRPLQKKVSLKELRDLSAFEVHLVPIDDMHLSDSLRYLMDSLGELPKRSTDPKLQPLIALRDEMDKLRDEIFQTSHKQDYRLNPEQVNNYFKKIAEHFKKRLELFFASPEKNSEEAGRQAAQLRHLLDEFPHFVDAALSVVKNRQELDDFGIFRFDPWGQPHQNAKVDKRREELDFSVPAELQKIPAFRQLPKAHQEMVFFLQSHTIPLPKDIGAFCRDLKKVPQDLLHDYSEFIRAHPDKFKDADDVQIFTRYTQGLNREQFERYRGFCEKKYFYEDVLKEVNATLRRYPNWQDLQWVEYLLEESTDQKKVGQQLRRIKKLLSQKKAEEDTLRWRLRENARNSSFVLSCFENLDQDHLANNFDLILERFFSYDMNAAHFRKLNTLKPHQRMGLRYLALEGVDLKLITEKEIDQLLATLVKIQTQAEMDYVLANAPRNVINAKAILEGAGPFSPLAWASRASVEGFEQTRQEAAKYSEVWTAIDTVEKQNPENKLAKEAHEVLGMMIDKGLPQEKILAVVPHLPHIQNSIQRRTIEILLSESNALEVIRTMAACQEKCKEFYWDESIQRMYYKIINETPPLEVVLRLIDQLVAVKNNPESLDKMGALEVVLEKTTSHEEFFQVLANMENPDFTKKIRDIMAQERLHLVYGQAEMAVAIYFYLAVSPADLRDPDKVAAGLKTFLDKAEQTKYDRNIDPDLNRAALLLGPEQMLNKPDTSFTHIAFILNILRDSAPEYSKEKMTIMAKKQLGEADPVLQEKGAKILIGLENDVQLFDRETIVKIAKAGVDDKLTNQTVSDNITVSQLEYLKKPDHPKVPLSLYFSWLINLEERGKSGNETEFRLLVGRYKTIEKQPVYEGKLLALAHDVNDKNHSYLFADDSFNTEAHRLMAGEVQGLPTEILRHGKDGESVESMFSALETAQGNLTLVVGGHGGRGLISFGAETFDMDMLFERLAKRLERQKEGGAWQTTVIFESCYSDYNIEAHLMKRWQEDPRTKSHPIKMLSSSSEDEGSAKMAGDSWLLKAKQNQAVGRVLTWGELYRDIESRNFIMSNKRINSNMTLFIDGKKFG